MIETYSMQRFEFVKKRRFKKPETILITVFVYRNKETGQIFTDVIPENKDIEEEPLRRALRLRMYSELRDLV